MNSELYYIKHKDYNNTNNNIDNLEVVEKWIKPHYENMALKKEIKKAEQTLIKVAKKEQTKQKRTELRTSKKECNICKKMISFINYAKHSKTHNTIILEETVEPVITVEPVEQTRNTFNDLSQEEQEQAINGLKEHIKQQEQVIIPVKPIKPKIKLKNKQSTIIDF